MSTGFPTDPREIGLALFFGCCLAGCAAFESGRTIPATPQRPTFSNDTSMTAPGTLELETGFALDPDDRIGTPSALKLGLDQRSEVFLGLEPLIFLDTSRDDELGFGDLLIGYRRRFEEEREGRPALAYQAALKAPTADENDGLGSGETDLFVSLSATWAGTSWSKTAYAQVGVLGDPGGGSWLQSAGSFTAGVPLENGLSAFGEVAALLTPEIDDEQLLFTLGLAKAWTPGRVFDFGIVLGLGDDAPDLQLLIGTTVNLGRVVTP